jgi:hypothetical protein
MNYQKTAADKCFVLYFKIYSFVKRWLNVIVILVYINIVIPWNNQITTRNLRALSWTHKHPRPEHPPRHNALPHDREIGAKALGSRGGHLLKHWKRFLPGRDL